MGELTEALQGVSIPDKAKALVIEADRLFTTRREDALYVEYLIAEIKKLESQVENLRKEKGISGAREKLSFDQTTGTYKEEGTSLRYCAKCLAEEKRSPMHDYGHGWQCPVCKTSAWDPARPMKPMIAKPGIRGF